MSDEFRMIPVKRLVQGRQPSLHLVVFEGAPWGPSRQAIESVNRHLVGRQALFSRSEGAE